MKKISFITCFIIFLCVSVSFAGNVNVYTKVGGMELVEHNISEGHKAVTALGINLTHGKDIIMTYNLEGWSMVEAVDEDPEMPKYGFQVGAEVKYNLDKIYPFVSLNYNSWERDFGDFTNLNYLTTNFGIDGKWKRFYSRVGGIYPIWNETNYSDSLNEELGFLFDIGFIWKKISIGYSYKRVSFTELETNFSGIKVTYTF